MIPHQQMEQYLIEKLTLLGLHEQLYSVGETSVDTPYVIQYDGAHWCFGHVERGLFRPEARFNDAINAAEYMIFQINRPSLKSMIPDWSDYAQIFGAAVV